MTGVFVIGSAVSVLPEQLFTDPYGSGQWAPAGYTQLVSGRRYSPWLLSFAANNCNTMKESDAVLMLLPEPSQNKEGI